MIPTSKQVVTYERFSPRRRNGEAKCESCLTQRERLQDYCRALGLEIVGDYHDDEVSGKSMDGRPGLEAALAHVRKVKGILMVYSLSRLARNTRDAILITEQLNTAGCELSSLHERIDTSTPIGRFFFTIMASLAQLEREQISERTSEAMLSHQARGRRMTGRTKVPYGYQLDPADEARQIPNPAEQLVVERIRQLHANGFSNRRICRELDAAGINRRGKPWAEQHAMVRGILRREATGIDAIV